MKDNFKKGLLTVFLLLFCMDVEQAQQQNEALKIEPKDVYVESHADGFHLFIRKKPGLESVMLTEAFELPNKKVDTYSLKGFMRNDVNGNEKRLLGGKFLSNDQHFFLIDSTSQSNKKFGMAFHILIPAQIQYGYKDEGKRYGVHNLLQYKEEGKPYWFSIRAFSKPYQDYTGDYRDNAYELFITEREQVEQQAYMADEEGYYTGLYKAFGGISIPSKSKGKDSLANDFSKLLDKAVEEMPKGSLDIAIVLDTTQSIYPHLPQVKRYFLKVIEECAKDFPKVRVGFIFFKDYMEEYLTKAVDFQDNFSVLSRQIQNVSAGGGGDFPEAVYEGVYAALTQLSWRSDNRLLILIGDAPPHEIPRGEVTESMVIQTAQEKGVNIYSIMLPFDPKVSN